MSADSTLPGFELPGPDPDMDVEPAPVAVVMVPGQVPGTITEQVPGTIAGTTGTFTGASGTIAGATGTFSEQVPGIIAGATGTFTGPEPGTIAGTTGTIAGQLPGIEVPEDRIGFPQHLWLSLLDRAREAVEHQKRHRTFWHWLWDGFWNSSPESLADHRKYLQSRQWLEDYMTGGVRWVIHWENVVYGVLIARTVKAACQTIDRIVQRQSRFWILVVIVIIGILIRFVSHH